MLYSINHKKSPHKPGGVLFFYLFLLYAILETDVSKQPYISK